MTTTTTTLVVLCGLPAAGKSTFARALSLDMGAFVLTADEIRTHGASAREVFQRVNAALVDTLAAGHSAIVDTCALQAFQRMRWQRIGRRADVRCELVFVDTPWRICMERDAEREHKVGPINWLSCARQLADAYSAAKGEDWDLARAVVGTSPYVKVLSS